MTKELEEALHTEATSMESERVSHIPRTRVQADKHSRLQDATEHDNSELATSSWE